MQAIAPNLSREIPEGWWTVKRLTDLTLGGALLVIALPIIAACAVAIVLVTGGPPFFAQERIGMYGRPFRMYKLRTMVKNAHSMRDDVMHLNEVSGPVFKIKNDPRLHPIGKFLRRLSLDELPNLFNVLRGDMSLVGPRPALPCEVKHYDDFAYRRLSVPQGITCLWQVSGRSDVSFDQWMRLDNAYVDSWTPLGDIGIVLKTIPAVLRKVGAH